MQKELLTSLGLSKDETIIYSFLLENGEATAGVIIKKNPFKRGTVYNILKSLKEKGIVEENEDTKIAKFKALHPSHLLKFAEEQERNAQLNKEALNTILPDFISRYNLSQEKPGVRFYEGIQANQRLYEDILRTNEDYQFVRMTYESTFKEAVKPVFKQFMKKRIKQGLKVRAITPADDKHATEEARKEQERKDKDILFDRTWVDPKLYNAPVEIDIYGDRVAMMSYGKEFIGMIIQSKQISDAMKQLFELARIGAKVKSGMV